MAGKVKGREELTANAAIWRKGNKEAGIKFVQGIRKEEVDVNWRRMEGSNKTVGGRACMGNGDERVGPKRLAMLG